MPIYKQPSSDVWFVDLHVDGRRVRRSTGTKDKKQAQEYHDRLKADLRRQESFGDKPERKWEEAVKKYLIEKSDKKSIEHDKKMLRWATPYLKGKLLSQINNQVIENLIEERREGHNIRIVDGVSNATINRHMEAIQRVLNRCVEWEWLSTAPETCRDRRFQLAWLETYMG